MKKQQEILAKLGIDKLNSMQEEALLAITSTANTVLLSPTGTGKTVAFLLPIISELVLDNDEIQVLILVPSRELAIQIEQVIREMGTGFKANAVYGGRPFSKDKIDLNHTPTILIGTPGRIADHFRRETISAKSIKTLVLDEFDKSLEIGFESEMREIISSLAGLEKRILTSATQELKIPQFVGVINPLTIDYSGKGDTNLQVKTVASPTKDKLDTLFQLLCNIGDKPGIIFCNFRETIEYVGDYLSDKNIAYGVFSGGMEQKDRERSLIKFRNGTQKLIIATDLAARGLDIPELGFIIHYQLPLKEHEFTHRNGRTARMHAQGTAYVLHWENEELPEFINATEAISVEKRTIPKAPKWETLFISGGRKDKISKGDIAGLFFKQGNLEKGELGEIELKQDCAFVGVPASKAMQLISLLNNSKLKKKKVRISLV